jgi:hypothetical protein
MHGLTRVFWADLTPFSLKLMKDEELLYIRLRHRCKGGGDLIIQRAYNSA